MNYDHFKLLYKAEQWKHLINISENIKIMDYNSFERYDILYNLYMAHYNCGNYNDCIEILKLFKTTYVNEHIIVNSSLLFSKLNKTIVGTTDINRKPNENEIVIIYGNFHYSIDNLPTTNIVYRHPLYFDKVKHDIVEFDECWKDIDIIYILNLVDRYDRYLEILVELCKINAPLNKIYHYKAQKKIITGNKKTDIYYGAGKNHIDVVNHFIQNNYNKCLILEDDVTFTSNITMHKNDLKIFLDRKYDFDICFITSSIMGEIRDYDDLLLLSYQYCTTSSGYILTNKTAKKVLDVLEEGNMKLLETGDDITYCCDRYWSKIQKDNKVFIFKNKFGYQRPSYSSITQNTACHFD